MYIEDTEKVSSILWYMYVWLHTILKGVSCFKSLAIDTKRQKLTVLEVVLLKEYGSYNEYRFFIVDTLAAQHISCPGKI